eukprot:scaffold1440_cov332-Pavlova_lutheri.AAC.18
MVDPKLRRAIGTRARVRSGGFGSISFAPPERSPLLSTHPTRHNRPPARLSTISAEEPMWGRPDPSGMSSL